MASFSLPHAEAAKSEKHIQQCCFPASVRTDHHVEWFQFQINVVKTSEALDADLLENVHDSFLILQNLTYYPFANSCHSAL